jgi:hypothetical protein
MCLCTAAAGCRSGCCLRNYEEGPSTADYIPSRTQTLEIREGGGFVKVSLRVTNATCLNVKLIHRA